MLTAGLQNIAFGAIIVSELFLTLEMKYNGNVLTFTPDALCCVGLRVESHFLLSFSCCGRTEKSCLCSKDMLLIELLGRRRCK